MGRSQHTVPKPDTQSGITPRLEQVLESARDWREIERRDAARAVQASYPAAVSDARARWERLSALWQMVHHFSVARSSAYRMLAQLGPLDAVLHARRRRARRRWRLYLETHRSRTAADRWLNRHEGHGEHGWIAWEHRDPAVWGPLSLHARRRAAEVIRDAAPHPVFRAKAGARFEWADRNGTLRALTAEHLEGPVGYVVAPDADATRVLQRMLPPLSA